MANRQINPANVLSNELVDPHVEDQLSPIPASVRNAWRINLLRLATSQSYKEVA